MKNPVRIPENDLLWIDLQWFAAEDEGRTEDPTEYKLRKAREEGRVAKSQELNGALVLLIPALVLVALAPGMMNTCTEMIRFFLLRSTTTEINDPVLAQAFLRYFIKLVLPIAASAVLAGLASNLVQNGGFIFSVKPIAINMGKISPNFPKYFKRVLFSSEGLFNLAKSLMKVGVIAFVAYLTIRGEVPRLVSMLSTSLWQAIVFVASLAARIILVSAIIFIAISVPDYVFQRRQFIESLKMTRQEIKEEYKQMEGDPLVKSRLRQRMRELLSQNMMVNVPKADVVITNPTHFAVAMQWDRSTMRAPMLTAKGADLQAQRIKQLARENDVPIVENKPLARALYAEVEIGDMIPDEYYQALAVILAKVYALDSRKQRMLKEL
ncbi:MAG TPA: flagellar biosynthesis protein FlhB [Treponemataceae bacterium]|jgi:flagellar biosynthetic protein FlhB|nr:flagellar biosynthesis protein FlhB [Treponemataceae bacterium]HOS36083.1 flagellar biosynthesis protein FlhB [Treponemataceae bacterium]HOU37504.1 flagellar biosynthesis protein FlhB [Treponemataceae bacterium]HPL92253.1 flagellar biosynthesis protein FlhB [Treponemataceae bacterium]HQF72769.1 flagellar biosynthesis protein FlhB [Treponemataceae bacterium]